ncbi:mechanosensitive ion channel family protein [Pedobacter sp. V48]|uniref:mechanosensitive ion channel family protein n=1 Tax=Pedobacter sp. V48 TaxID=509635 RepID=UPI00066456B7|nr:mechanosensitive ion channel family protein [Pedobacter sp. V48]
MKKVVFKLCLCLWFYPLVLIARQDTLKQKPDTSQVRQLNNDLNKVKQLAAERLSDSLKRSDLQEQVARLGTGDDAKRETIIAELNALKKRDSLHLAEQKQQIDALRKVIKGAPVVYRNDTLFYIYTRQGSFSAIDRAEAVAVRMLKLAQDLSFKTDSIKVQTTEETTDLVYKNALLVSISDPDALWNRTTKTELAALLKSKIGTAVFIHQQETSWQILAKEVLLTLLVIVVVFLLIKGVNRLFAWMELAIRNRQGRFKDGIRIRNYELLNAERQLTIIAAVVSFFRWAVIILVIYLALPVLFGIFPFTRDLSVSLLNYILTPLKKIGFAVWDFVPNIITILVLIIVFRYVLRLLRFIKTEIERGKLNIPGFYADWASPTYQIARALLLAFMLVVIFPYLPGHDSDIFKGVSVFMGVLFTFGSAGALSNVVAGLVLTYMRAFKIGDRVKIGEVTGDIIGKTLLVTRVRTIQNEIVSIPNSTVMGNHTVNYSEEAGNSGLIVNTTVTIGYDVPWRQVHQLLIDAALASEMIEPEPKPYVYQTSLDDYYVSYRINAYTKQPNRQAAIYSSLHANIQDHFNQAGVEIMSPHYKALRDGNSTTIPADYLPQDYAAPVFKTSTEHPKQD